MSLLDRIHTCNHFDIKQVYPFCVGTQQIGWIKWSHWLALSQWPKLFLFDGVRVTLSNTLKTFEARTEALKEVVLALREGDLVSQWQSEMYGER